MRRIYDNVFCCACHSKMRRVFNWGAWVCSYCKVGFTLRSAIFRLKRGGAYSKI